MMKLRVCWCFFGFLIYSKGNPLNVNLMRDNVGCFDIFNDNQAILVTMLPQVVSVCDSHNTSASPVTSMCEDLIKWKLCPKDVNDGLLQADTFGDEMEKYIAQSNSDKLCRDLSFLNISDCQHVCTEDKSLCSYYGGMLTELQEAFHETMEEKEGYKLLYKFKHMIQSLVPFPPLGIFSVNPALKKCLKEDTTDIDDVCRLLAHIADLSMQAHVLEINHTKYLANNETKTVKCELLKNKKDACMTSCLGEQATDTKKEICRMIAFGVEQLYGPDSPNKESTLNTPEVTTTEKESKEFDKKAESAKNIAAPITTKPNQRSIATTQDPMSSTSNPTSTTISSTLARNVNKPTSSQNETLVNLLKSPQLPPPVKNETIDDKNSKTSAAPPPQIAPSTAKLTNETITIQPTTSTETSTTDDGILDDNQDTKNGADAKVETNKDTVSQTNLEQDEKGSNIFSYILVLVVLSIAGYIVFQNKHKIIALVVEGKSSAGRRPSTKKYKKLKTEDVMPNFEHSASSKTYVF
ncbi:uncharacterized protein LOC127866177 [Dreissena polymorpha]|nr:uncharacterized protein LOC127866177 [Dreissena polymorpha]